MVARSMAELERMLMNEIKHAMDVVSVSVEADMFQETGAFYTGGEPRLYTRTGALGNTPRTTALTTSGKNVSFEAYLDTSHTYTTGSFSMTQVLTSAEKGQHGIVGAPGFWARSQQRIEKTLNRVMGSFFH